MGRHMGYMVQRTWQSKERGTQQTSAPCVKVSRSGTIEHEVRQERQTDADPEFSNLSLCVVGGWMGGRMMDSQTDR